MNPVFVPGDCNTSELAKPFGVCVLENEFYYSYKTDFRESLSNCEQMKGNQLRSVHCKLFPHD